MAKTAVASRAEVIRKPLMSGHCASHRTGDTLSEAQAISHDRCVRNGAGQRANPAKEFQPCPCRFHYDTDESGEPAEIYECGGCGREIVEAWYWPVDEDGETRYTHIDGTGRALGEECENEPKVSRNPVTRIKTCPQCGVEMDADDPNRLCGECQAAEDDFSDLDFDDDDFSDLDDL